MVAVRVWLGGEGTSELGGRADATDRVGAIEALLLRLEPTGWTVAGATQWKRIRKYRAGAALRGGISHADVANVLGLVLEAHENGCEVVAFSRDRDADEGREAAVTKGIELAVFDPPVAIIGGLAVPCLEGWILALVGQRDTDHMSRQRAADELVKRKIALKDTDGYVKIIEDAYPDGLIGSLPVGCHSLRSWLSLAVTILARAIRGA